MRTAVVLFFLSFVLFAMGSVQSSQAQERIALVIGNSTYQHAEALPNPQNDAVAIGDALEEVGFDVMVSIDLDQRGMQTVLRDFGLKAETAEVALVYFAGHGIQVASQNYLLPIDAQLRRERDLIYEATPLSIVMAEVAQAKQLGMVILDACRDNPLAENLRQSLGPVRSKLIGLGMARVEDVPPDTLIAFSTRFNQLAYDGAGDLSPFTSSLVKHIQEPGLELNLFFRKVRDSVLELTANRQEPRTLDALGAKPFYFTAPKSNKPPELGEVKPLIVADKAGATDLDVGMPTDVDNDALTIEVMGLPTFGVMENGDQPLNFGDELTVAELKALRYSPDQGKIGEAGAFLFVVRDGEGGVTAGRVPINVIRSNEVPVVAAPKDIVWPSIPLGIEAPTDPDGDPLSIKVLAVPGVGDIKNGDRTVSVGDDLSIEALTGLMLDPSNGVAGEFTYEVADDHGGVSESLVRLQLPGPNAAVTVAARPVSPASEAADDPAVAGEPEPENMQMRRTNKAPEEGIEAETALSGQNDEVAITFLETVTASNIRRGPGTDAGWVKAVPAGTQLKLVRENVELGWYEIETADGQPGFIASSLVKPIEGGTEQPPLKAKQQPPNAEQLAAAANALRPRFKPDAPDEPEIAEPSSPDGEIGDAASEFSECDNCPVMITLPSGQFEMGSTSGDSAEQPVRQVVIEAPIAIGKFEVTAAEWQACAVAGFCPKIADLKPGDEQLPVQNVSWADAEAFVAWLRKETNQAYRLPTEAEWEYAARGGTQTRFWWGDDFEEGRANCVECDGEWNRKRPSDVGSYGPNPFGLHDMNGGVSEWVADCWIGDYQDAPSNGAARSLGFCPQRVLRGGSWRSEPDDVTSSSRFRYDAQVRYYTNGLRVARDLN